MDSLSQFSLAGRRALVTGSSRGIGLAIATALAGAGAELILNARDTVALGEAAAAAVMMRLWSVLRASIMLPL